MADSSGSAAANDATISTDPQDPVDLRQRLIDEADARVAGCETRVQRQQGHLEGAKSALADARAARKGI